MGAASDWRWDQAPLTRAAQLETGTPNSVGFSGLKAVGASAAAMSAAAVAVRRSRACRR